MVNTDIGLRLMYWRKYRRFLSATALSQQTGVTRAAIHDIEKGKRYPRKETLDKLIGPNGLNITLDELLATDISQVRLSGVAA